MSAGNKKMNGRALILTTAVGATGILVAAQLMAKPSAPTATNSSRTAANGSRATAKTEAEEKSAANVQVKPATTQIRDLFRPLVVTAPATPAPPTALKPEIPVVKPVIVSTPKPAPAPRPSAPTPPPAPSANDLQMMGVVEMGDEVQVLLKQRNSGESRYFAKGDNAFGFTVDDIQATQVAVSRNGQKDTVRMASTVTIEGPGSASSAPASGIGGGFGGGFGGGRGFGRRNRRGGDGDGGGFGGGNNGGGGNRGGGGGGGESTGFSTASIFSLPTWTERLKKLEEMKAQIEPARYDSLHKFMSERAKGEAKK